MATRLISSCPMSQVSRIFKNMVLPSNYFMFITLTNTCNNYLITFTLQLMLYLAHDIQFFSLWIVVASAKAEKVI